jgi:hypothetical protein
MIPPRLLLHLAFLIVPCALAAQSGDTTRVDSLARLDWVVTGGDLHHQSPSSIVGAMLWLQGVTLSESGRLGYRNRLLDGESFVVDGMTFGDRFTPADHGSPFGSASGVTFVPSPSMLSIASAALRSNAGVTRAGSGDGIVEISMRRGSSERFTGGGFVRSDVAPLFGSSDEIRAHIPGEERDTLLHALKAAAADDRLYELFVEGPIPGIPVAIHVSTKYNSIGYYGATYDLLDAPQSFFDARRDSAAVAGHVGLDPTNVGRLPGSSAMQWDLYGNVSIEPSDRLSMFLSGEIGIARRDVGELATLYMLDHPTFGASAPGRTQIGDSAWADLSILERDAQGLSSNVDVTRVQASLRYDIDDRSTIGLDLVAATTNEAAGKREVRDYGPLEGFEIYRAEDRDRDRMLDRYEDLSRQTVLNQYLPSNARSIVRERNPTTGLFEGGYGGAAISPFGAGFSAHGNARGLLFRRTGETRARLTYSTADSLFGIGAEVNAGLEGAWYTLRKYENSIPWSPNPFFDIYGYGSTIWSADSSLFNLATVFEPAHEPVKGAAFARATWNLEALRVTTGLRLDLFDANAVVLTPADRRSYSAVLAAFDEPIRTTTKLDVNPELVIAYRPSEIGEMSIGFMSWTTPPAFDVLYSGAYSAAARGYIFVGNPDLAPARTRRFELDASLDVGLGTRVNAAAYSELVSGAVGVTSVSAVPSTFSQYDDKVEASRIGGELGVVTRFDEHISIAANWHLGRATARHPEQSAANGEDLPTSFDRTHAVNATLNVEYGSGEGPTVGGAHLLSNTKLFIGAGYRSGRARFGTVSSPNTPATLYEPYRLPGRWISAASLSREIPLADLFGESVGAIALELSIDVENLLDRTDAIDTYTNRYGMATSPTNDYEAMNAGFGQFSATPAYRDLDPDRPETYATVQYDRYGARLYDAYIDSNLDGVVTQLEKHEGYQRSVAMTQSLRENYQFPRQVFLRLGVRF